MRMFRFVRLMALALLVSLVPASSFAGVLISVNFGPPLLPVYEQPPCPEDGWMWTPGYWAYDYDMGDYYWVPGTWVPAPYVGALWTPGYWGWLDGMYVWYPGYWGPHVGYYGGVDYGFGYMGWGFAGGEWRGAYFAYNTAVMHVDTRYVRNVYVDQRIVERTTIVNDRHVAYSGGPGGINHPPMPEERLAERDQHVAATPMQQSHEMNAGQDKGSFSKSNAGRPATTAVARPITTNSNPTVTGSGARGGTGAGPGTTPAGSNGQGNAAPGNSGARPTYGMPQQGSQGANNPTYQNGRTTPGTTPAPTPNPTQVPTPGATQGNRPPPPSQPSVNRPNGPGAQPQGTPHPPPTPQTKPAPTPQAKPAPKEADKREDR